MSIFPESQTGIWLNTPIKFIDTRSEKKFRVAQNDSDWGLASRDEFQHLDATESEFSSFLQHRAVPVRRSLPGEDARFHHNPSRTLFAHVKFNIVTEALCALYFKAQVSAPSFTLIALDLGCSQQLLRRYIKKDIPNFEYAGLDRIPLAYPDLLSDLTDTESTEAFDVVTPNAVFALDVLSELHSSEADLSQTLARWGKACRPNDPMFFFTIPQCSSSESHKLHLEFEQWKALLEQHFIIEETRSLGFLSALPYWLNTKLRLNKSRFLGRIINALKEPMYESHLLKAIDLSVTRILGNVRCLRRFSHSVLFTARVRHNYS